MRCDIATTASVSTKLTVRKLSVFRGVDLDDEGRQRLFSGGLRSSPFLARHQPGDVIEGVVTRQVPFGSFVESEGFTGLAHQQSWPAGTRVSVRILAIDPDNQRFSLAPA